MQTFNSLSAKATVKFFVTKGIKIEIKLNMQKVWIKIMKISTLKVRSDKC